MVDNAQNSLVSYKAASDIAMTELPPTHLIRIGLSPHFSMFCYDILHSHGRACRLAKEGKKTSMMLLQNWIHGVSEVTRTPHLFMPLLCDNLTLWTSDRHGDEMVESMKESGRKGCGTDSSKNKLSLRGIYECKE
ncbi:hypothetical protein FKM82_026401 [Ascaphus truei]